MNKLEKSFLYILSLFLGILTFSLNGRASLLTTEEIEKYNQALKLQKAEIIFSFNPDNVTAIVVGCNIAEHETHFFGGSYSNMNGASGYIYQNMFVSFKELKDQELANITDKILWITKVPNEKTNELKCSYVHESTNFKSDTKAEALRKAEELGLRSASDAKNIWETDPSTTLYINKSALTNRDSDNHIRANFEHVDLTPFLLKKVEKIIIEYYSKRTKKNYVTLIERSLQLLQPGGTLLLEVLEWQKDQIQEILSVSTDHFPIEYKFFEGIPGRCQNACNSVVCFSAVKL